MMNDQIPDGQILEFAVQDLDFERDRPVALTARASDSKSEGWGFKSLLACQTLYVKRYKRNIRITGKIVC
jgi:hypothetical protein